MDPTEKKFAYPCTNHVHDMKCPRCCLLPDTVIELKRIISEFTDIETADGKVLAWKIHILRCVNQDRCRVETLQNITKGDAMLVMDWAMKFLPLRHREKQSVYIKEYNFSEAHNGKSYCDSKIDRMSWKMRKYVLEGGDIRSITEIKEALDVYGGVSGCQISNATIDNESQAKDQSQLKGITKYSNLKIDHDGRLTC
ncbi:Hypothetical predicted protein [Mytilus galloprovincialis]|uniref:Uncharacterized protein n=1 Tax=Mytilus galloprovincialis TaxID=29158 RepID=A0A8B6DSA3_MYTGA|nr:Hypothetical predicted protein [Mytilus galloprovincialis]